MNLNIAFNTIIYIMVFLFPGIIFRKSFFSGKFKNQFDQGNVLERFLWNILTSVICVFSFGIITYYLTVVLNYKLFDSLEYKDIYDLFNDLSKNHFPKKLETLNGLILFVSVFAALYFFCAYVGYAFYYLVTRLKLDKNFSLFRFNNPWEYLTTVNSNNFKSLKLLENYTTYIDVLIGDKDSKDLYRGRIHEIIYDKDNKIEHIALKNTLRFDQIPLDENSILEKSESGISVNGRFIKKENIHLERNDKIVYKKIIDGHIFIIPNNNIHNINLTYVEISNNLNKLSKILFAMCIVFSTLGALFVVINLFFNLILSTYLDTLTKRIVFSVCTFALIILLLNLIVSPKDNKKEKNLSLLIYSILLFLYPYLYLFNFITSVQFAIIYPLIISNDLLITKISLRRTIFISILIVSAIIVYLNL